jgi:hypothetical protein
MAIRTIRIGSLEDVLIYDDANYDAAFETDHTIKAGPPIEYNDVLRLGDMEFLWPVGSVFLSVVSTNPATLLGFGTWVQISKGQFLIGQDPSDPSFASAENSGGSKTHTHDVDIPNTTSSGPNDTESVDNNADGSTVNVASDSHNHDVNPAAVTSTTNSNLPPFFVIYIWKRTA